MAWSQIIADPTAPANQRPTVLSDSAGRPLVNIQTPSAAGLSRNTYKQFDVPTSGIVLNNSVSNPWLSNGVLAKTILNEVNSTSQSYINGGITVNGAAAQVIVANPNGITVNGGGFVNATRATLTTGTAQVASGALTGLDIRGGRVTIGPSGLNNSATPYTDILSRAVTLTGRLQAQNLGITTGLQTVAYDTGLISQQDANTYAAGTLAIDTAALGGMYANNISLLATEAGLGVRNQGAWQAGGGQIVVTSDGFLQNLGSVSAGVVSLATASGNIDNMGSLQGSQAVVMSAGNDARLYGAGLNQAAGSAVMIGAKGAVNLYNDARYGAAQVASAAPGGQISISAGKNINLQTEVSVAAHKDVQLLSDATVAASGASITSTAGNVTVLAGAGIALSGSTVTGDQVHLETGAAFKDTAASLVVTGGSIRGQTQTTLLASDSIRVSSPGSTAVSSGGNLHIQASKATTIAAGTSVAAGQHMSVLAGTSLNLQAAGGSDATNGQKVTLSAGGNLLVAGNSVTATGSNLSAGQDLSIEANEGNINLLSLSNAGGSSVDKIQISAGRDLNVSAFKGSLYATGLQATGQNINLMSVGTTRVTSATVSDGVNTQAVASTLTARDDLTVGSIDPSGGAGGQTQVVASNLSAGGQARVLSSGLTLVPVATNTLNGSTTPVRSSISAGSVAIQGGTVQTHAADIRANGDNSTATKSGDINVTATTGNATFNAHTGIRTQFNSTGSIALHANGNLVHSYTEANGGSALSNTSATGQIIAAGAKLMAKDVLSLSSKGGQTHVSGWYEGGATLLFNESGTMTLNGTKVRSIGKVSAPFASIDGQLGVESGGPLVADGASRFDAATDLSIVAGIGDITITSDRSVSVTAGLHLDQSQFTAGRDLAFVTRNGTLTLAGTPGAAGNPSAKVVTMNSRRDLRLAGSVVQVQGSKLAASRDVNITSHGGSVLIDGVKNSFSSYVPQERIDSLVGERSRYDAQIQREQALLNASPTYVALKSRLGALDEEFAALMMEAPWLAVTGILPQMEQISRELAPYTAKLNGLIAERDQISKFIGAISARAKGAEHLGAAIGGRNINISSSSGIAVYGAEIAASGVVNLGSSGSLPIDGSAVSGELNKPVGTLVAGLSDFYEYGAPGTGYHAFSLISRPSVISGQLGVVIQAAGGASDSRLVLNDAAVKSSSGAVRLQSVGDMRLESGQEEFYSQSINTYTRRSFFGLRKKTVTETRTNQSITASPVVLEGQSIVLKSGGSIDAYATEFLAPQGGVQMVAGNALNLRAMDQVSVANFDAKSRSSFLGMTYSKGTTTNSRTVSEQLPSRVVATGASTSSGWNTLLQGTIFQTSLTGATISAGVGDKARADAQIVLEGIKRTVTESKTKERNYVVWQRQLGSGSTVQTMALPSFTGQQAPVFNAPGGLAVQIPDGDFKSQINTLGQQPGMGYLNTLAARGDVNWQPVKLAFDQWSYKQEGLTPAGAALLAAAVAWAMPAGVGASLVGAQAGSTSALMANAAFTSLAAQAAIAFVNNKGNVGKTLNDLAKSDVVKATIAAAITAGVLEQLGATNGMSEIKDQLAKGTAGFSEKLTYNLINATGRALTNTAITGGNLEDALKQALVGGLVDTAHGQVASQIKGLEADYLAHKLAHALAGCVAGAAAGGACKDGAIGGAVGEIVAEMFKGQKPPASASEVEVEAYNQKVLGYSKLVAGAMSAYAGGNAQTAITTAETAVRNNYLTDKQWKDFSKKLAACGSDKTCEATARSEYLQLSKLQDAQLATCDARGDCDSLANNVFTGRAAMLQLVNAGRLPAGYAGALDMQYMGQRLATDSAFRKQVGNAVEYMNWCTANPTSCSQDQLQKAMGLGVLVLGPVIAANSQLVAAILYAQNGERSVSAAIGGGVNALAQALSSGKVKAEDVLKAAATAYATAGANLATTMAVNVGAEGMVSWVKNDTANEAMSNMLLSAAGTAVGFKVGDLTKGSISKFTDSYSATMKSKPTGILTIEGPYSRSAWPSTWGNIGGSAGSEGGTLYFSQIFQDVRGK